MAMPSTPRQRKTEVIQKHLEEGNLGNLLVEYKEAQKEVNRIKELIDEKRDALAQKMLDLKIEAVDLNENYTITVVHPTSYPRIKKGKKKVLQEKFPQYFTTVKRNGYIQVRTK